MGRALAKPHPRFIGIDDGAFSRRHRWAPVVAVVLSFPAQLEAVAVGRVRVDGRDATEVAARLVAACPASEGAHALLVDGVTMGGFNVLDLDELHRRVGIPLVAVTRRPPDLERVRAALAQYFPADFRVRWSKVRQHPLFRVPTSGRPLWAAAVGCRRADAAALVQRAAVRGFWPEPLRVAHAIAHALGTSEPRVV